jgi:hypothetical protein
MRSLPTSVAVRLLAPLVLAVLPVAARADALPRVHPYQQTLCRHLGSLTKADLTPSSSAKLDETKAVPQDADRLFRDWALTLMNQPLVGTKRGVPAVSAPGDAFLLSNIEREGKVFVPPVWPETLAALVAWDYPGNVHHNDRGLQLRAFVGGAVQMMMFHQFAEANDQKKPAPIRPDWHGYNPVYWAAGYPAFKAALPADVQQAYETGLKMVGERMIAWGIRGESCETDLKSPVGLVTIARAVNDPAFSAKVEAFVKPVFTDPAFIHPAGYWVERGGPDLGFAGAANVFASWIALATDWPFAKEALDKVQRLRSHLILPEPDGALTGPSHFNSRLGSPASADQFTLEGVRNLAVALVTDEALPFTRRPTAAELAAAPAAQAHSFNEQISENLRDAKGHYYTKDELNVGNTMSPWQLKLWMTFNFPISVNTAYEFYQPGFAARLAKLESEKSPLLRSPYLRGENFVRDFSGAFVAVRQPAYAAIVHSGPVGGQSADDGKHQFGGPLGLGGGQLSAFWTPATGSVLLGLRSGMTYNKVFDDPAAWRTWPQHAVAGVTAGGVTFTSGAIRAPEAATKVEGDKATVTTKGTIPATMVGREQPLAARIDVAHAFTVDPAGVKVETTVSGDGKEPVAELYEVLPVFLHEADKQSALKPTTIEFEVGGAWKSATPEFVDGVTAVRLSRFDGAVEIRFASPRRAKLAPEAWQDQFLTRNRSHNVLVDLLGSGPAPVTDGRTIAYTIRAK